MITCDLVAAGGGTRSLRFGREPGFGWRRQPGSVVAARRPLITCDLVAAGGGTRSLRFGHDLVSAGAGNQVRLWRARRPLITCDLVAAGGGTRSLLSDTNLASAGAGNQVRFPAGLRERLGDHVDDHQQQQGHVEARDQENAVDQGDRRGVLRPVLLGRCLDLLGERRQDRDARDERRRIADEACVDPERSPAPVGVDHHCDAHQEHDEARRGEDLLARERRVLGDRDHGFRIRLALGSKPEDRDQQPAADPRDREEHVHGLEDGVPVIGQRVRREREDRGDGDNGREQCICEGAGAALGGDRPIGRCVHGDDLARCAGRFQGARCLQPLVDVRQVAGAVLPRRAHDPGLVDEEGGAARDVMEAAKLESDPEGPHDVTVEIGEQTEVQVERLRPRDVRPGRVAGDADRLHPDRVELGSPVTQELQFVRSGGGPVEQVEDEQLRPVVDELEHRERLVRSEEDLRVGDAVAGLEHAAEITDSTSGRRAPATTQGGPRAETARGCSPRPARARRGGTPTGSQSATRRGASHRRATTRGPRRRRGRRREAWRCPDGRRRQASPRYGSRIGSRLRACGRPGGMPLAEAARRASKSCGVHDRSGPARRCAAARPPRGRARPTTTRGWSAARSPARARRPSRSRGGGRSSCPWSKRGRATGPDPTPGAHSVRIDRARGRRCRPRRRRAARRRRCTRCACRFESPPNAGSGHPAAQATSGRRPRGRSQRARSSASRRRRGHAATRRRPDTGRPCA